MKFGSFAMAVAMAAGICAGGRVQAYSTVTVGVDIQSPQDFYEPLQSSGYWVEIPRYGWCWYPAGVDNNSWRPYGDGHWEWSENGWYWASDEPWAWATYHYGRWTWDAYYGWVWVPGVVWAPSWVCWREGGGYIGWAPLPPECNFAPGNNVIVVDRIVLAPQYFVFVQQRHFCEPIRPNILVVNQTVINQTVNITKITQVNQAVINQGPSLSVIEKNNPGRVVKVNIERRLPREVQQVRREQREIAVTQRAALEVIHGTRRIADATAVASPVPLQTGDGRDRPQLGRAAKVERQQQKRIAPQVPAPTGAFSEQAEPGKGRKLGHHKQNLDGRIVSAQGK